MFETILPDKVLLELVESAKFQERTRKLDALRLLTLGPSCHGRMKLIALVTKPKSIVRYLTKLSEPIDVPARRVAPQRRTTLSFRG